MKKLGTALCLSSALIASAPAQANWQGNWLVGASGGYYDREGDLQITQISPTGTQSTQRRGFDDIGWLVGLFGGYQIECCRWLFGAELNVDWNNEHHDHDLAFTDGTLTALATSSLAWNAHFKYEREWIVGLTGRIGYKIAPCLLPYLRLGLEWSRDTLHYEEAANSEAAVVLPFSGAVDGSKDSVRLIAGFGIEIPAPKCEAFTIRAEYDFHSRGKRVDASGVVIANLPVQLGAPLVASLDVSRKPYTQTAIVSVVWNI